MDMRFKKELPGKARDVLNSEIKDLEKSLEETEAGIKYMLDSMDIKHPMLPILIKTADFQGFIKGRLDVLGDIRVASVTAPCINEIEKLINETPDLPKEPTEPTDPDPN